MILVDSSVWIDYFNGRKTWQTDLLEKLLSDVPIIIGDLILAELLQGFRSDNDYKTAKSFLSDLPLRQMGGYQVAVQSAQNYRTLRKKGVTVAKQSTSLLAHIAFWKVFHYCMMTETLNQWNPIFH